LFSSRLHAALLKRYAQELKDFDRPAQARLEAEERRRHRVREACS
jgi:hypothetical protein